MYRLIAVNIMKDIVKKCILDFWSQDDFKWRTLRVYPLDVLVRSEYKKLIEVPNDSGIDVYFHTLLKQFYITVDKESEFYKELAEELCYECYLELFHPEELYGDDPGENPEPPTPEEEEMRVQEMIAMSDRIYEEELAQETGREVSDRKSVV